MFEDLSELKQVEYLNLAHLKKDEINLDFPIATIEIDPDSFMSIDEFHQKIKDL
jgi:hypothetical protein